MVPGVFQKCSLSNLELMEALDCENMKNWRNSRFHNYSYRHACFFLDFSKNPQKQPHFFSTKSVRNFVVRCTSTTVGLWIWAKKLFGETKVWALTSFSSTSYWKWNFFFDVEPRVLMLLQNSWLDWKAWRKKAWNQNWKRGFSNGWRFFVPQHNLCKMILPFESKWLRNQNCKVFRL